ncbi:hypothetical protein N665_0461s0004 [Sinapis alba]|nr:hypothetical protein N665_0461s0004 [Sinapis alba]
MGISKNMLITFVFTIFFIVSNVHCYPDFEVKFYKKCYGVCNQGPDGCMKFCTDMSIKLIGECNSGICCCQTKMQN